MEFMYSERNVHAMLVYSTRALMRNPTLVRAPEFVCLNLGFGAYALVYMVGVGCQCLAPGQHEGAIANNSAILNSITPSP